MSKTFTSFPSSFKSKTAQICAELALATLGVVAIALNVPWDEIFRVSHATGGDIPAHPVLIDGLKEALFSHGRVVHYSPKFWGGFEAFQFYFVFPYFAAALASLVFEPTIVFKFVVIFPVLLLPAACFFMYRMMGLGRASATIGSLCSIVFLHTNAHRIWGGSIFSALTGMIANSWAFFFYALALGVLIRARKERRFSIWFALFGVLTMSSHFYTSFLLFLVFVVFAIADLWKARSVKIEWREVFAFYSNALVVVLIMCWWIIPLLYYRPFSSEYGANFHIKFLETFSLAEICWFGASILFGLYLLCFRREESRATNYISCYLLLYLAIYFGRDILNTAVFTNGRLWPGLYFLCFVQLTLFIDWLLSRSNSVVGTVAIVATVFLVPPMETLREARRWMEWNFSGIEARPGAAEFKELVSILNQQPKGRVSFESYPPNHGILGSIRAFEELPNWTPHSVVEGGVVNSATVPGVPYLLQCLTSNSCAGWPPGSLMPEKDLLKAIGVMQALGVQYHIASRKENQEVLEASGQFERLFQGQYANLYKHKTLTPMVEVFDGEPLYLRADDPARAINQLIRVDDFQSAAVAFVEGQSVAESKVAPPESFLNLLLESWYSGKHTRARGWDSRTEAERGQVVLFLMLSKEQQTTFEKDGTLLTLPPFYIADRGFEPGLLFRKQSWSQRKILVPLSSDKDGRVRVLWNGGGYRLVGGSDDSSSVDLNFSEGVEEIDNASFSYLLFEPTRPVVDYPYIDLVHSKERAIRSGLSQSTELSLNRNITSECNSRIEYGFAELVLTTDCPGKPHLLKYSYYPKWRSDVPIFRSVNGHMLVVPTSKKTHLRHERGLVDYVSIFLSVLGVVLSLILYRRDDANALA